MRLAIIQLSLAAIFASGVVFAADKPLSAQQQKMVDCNKQATGKQGADRKAFMKECLKAKTDAAAATPAAPAAAAPAMTQQAKMKDCNKQAAGKKGDERKAFMKSCLSAHPS